MEARSPTSRKKSSAAAPAGVRKEFRAFLIRVDLAPGFSFLQTGARGGLSALGKIAAQVWMDLGSENGLRMDSAVFKSEALEGLLFLPVSQDLDRKVGLALRLLKARVTRATGKAGYSLLWKRAYQTEPLQTPQEIAAVRRRIVREASALKVAAD